MAATAAAIRAASACGSAKPPKDWAAWAPRAADAFGAGVVKKAAELLHMGLGVQLESLEGQSR